MSLTHEERNRKGELRKEEREGAWLTWVGERRNSILLDWCVWQTVILQIAYSARSSWHIWQQKHILHTSHHSFLYPTPKTPLAPLAFITRLFPPLTNYMQCNHMYDQKYKGRFMPHIQRPTNFLKFTRWYSSWCYYYI